MVSMIIQSGRLLFEYIDKNMLIEGHLYCIKLDNIYVRERLQNTNHLAYYYKLIPKSPIIQQQMEERSLNIILKKITGDNNFIW